MPLLIFIFDLRVPAAGPLMIDAFAGAVDIALDGAVGRGRHRAGGRRQQDRAGIGGRLGGAEDGGLLVADPPVPRRDEGALPHPGLGLARSFLIGIVIVRNPDIRQRPAVHHHPFLDVLAVDLAARHVAAAAVGLAHMAGPGLVVDMLDQFVARRHAAGPALAAIVEAELVDGRRVDAAQANAAGADHDLSPSRIFGTPVMSAACASAGQQQYGREQGFQWIVWNFDGHEKGRVQ